MILRAGLLHTPNVAAAGQGARYHGDPLHFKDHGLVALWDASRGVTLNGNDVSALANQGPGGNTYDVAQATAGKQPLYVGAPAYNGQPSIQFTAANTDTLQAGNVNPIAAGPYSMIGCWRFRALAGNDVAVGTNNAAGTAGVFIGTVGGNRGSSKNGTGGQTQSPSTAPSTALAEVWDMSAAAGGLPHLRINAADISTANANAGITDPGASGRVSIGSYGATGDTFYADMDFLTAAWWTSVLPANVAYRIAHRNCATFGVAAAA